MSKFRKFITTGLLAATLVAAVLAPTPASAWRQWYGWFGEGGWDTPAIVVLGGLILGSVSTGAGIYPYPHVFGLYGYPAVYGYPHPVRSCVVRSPVYDDWGNFLGSQWLRVAC